MSTPVQAAFAEAFRESRSAFGVPITIGGTEVTAIVTESAMSRELKLGGFEVDADFTARVLLSELPQTPTEGMQVSYKGSSFKAAKVAVQPGHDVVELGLKSPAR